MGRFVAVALLLTITARAADWSALDRYQQTITRAEFDDLLTNVYCPSGSITGQLTYGVNSVALSTNFTLRFATGTNSPPAVTKPIQRIALDPGHIGGDWAQVEERYFVRGHDRPVQEAVLNLTVARLLQARLEAAGLTVLLTKNDYQPVTDKRPDDFPPGHEQLFYRSAEITARARRLNEELHPDLTLCLHFNAAAWNERFDLVNDNRLAVFIHGNYLPDELADDEQRCRLFAKLLERSHATELAAAESIADALARATRLPPLPAGDSGVVAGTNVFVHLRNLAANRLFNGPVVFLEPYYQNNRIVYQRIQLGDYDGEREIRGRRYRSIFREYADAVADGLLAWLGR